MADLENQVIPQEQSEQELKALLQVRRDKLANLQAAGKDPYEKTSFPVNAYAADINDKFDEIRLKAPK